MTGCGQVDADKTYKQVVGLFVKTFIHLFYVPLQNFKRFYMGQMHREEELVLWRSSATKTLLVFTLMCSLVTVMLFRERSGQLTDIFNVSDFISCVLTYSS